jgi:peptide subunit release factor RF-3
VQNSTRGKREKIGRMVEMFAKEANPIEEARAGDIIALVSLADTETGDTLCDSAAPVVLERMRFPDPVISVSVKSKVKAEQEKFNTALGKMVRADPSLHLETDRETGQTILRGMGELHLEVTLDRMRTEFGVEGIMGRAAGGLPRNHHQENRPNSTSTRSRPAVPASSPKFGLPSSRWSAARASSSSTRPSAARCRRSSCPRSKRA